MFLVVLSQRGILDPFQDLGLRLTSPFAGIFDAVGEGLSGNSGPPQSELELALERAQAENALLRQQAGEVAALEEMLGFITGADPTLTFDGAEVIQRQTSNFQDLIAINKGSEAGLEEGMVVLSPGGSLVGHIVETFPSASWVRLISDPNTAIGVFVQRADATATMTSDGSGPLTLELATKNVDIQVGDKVVTDSKLGRFPDGLLIGVVSEVSGAEELFLSVTIEPSALLSRLDSVVILTSFVPDPLPEPTSP